MNVKAMLKSIYKIEESLFTKLSDVQKILLTTDGSVTRMLEILTGRPVVIVTKSRKLILANQNIAKELKIEEGEEINYREVYLKNINSNKALVFARSWTPIMNLGESIKKDLTSTDLPIGKILTKHKLEIRREITTINYIDPNNFLQEIFAIYSQKKLLSRFYNIIHESEILMRINEIFPISCFI